MPHIGYLTSDVCDVDFERARRVLEPIGLREDEILNERTANELRLHELKDRERSEREAQAAANEAAKKPGRPPVFDKSGRKLAFAKPPPPPAADLVALGGC